MIGVFFPKCFEPTSSRHWACLRDSCKTIIPRLLQTQNDCLALGLPTRFVQDNHSASAKGVVRGLHFQWQPPMGKLMRVTRGAAFLVAVDIRKASPTLGKWFGIEISAENMKEMWAPAGFARGFCALSDDVEVQYKCTGVYNGSAE